MCVCIYVYKYIYVYVCVCIYIHIIVYIYNVHIYIYIHVYICMYICMYIKRNQVRSARIKKESHLSNIVGTRCTRCIKCVGSEKEVWKEAWRGTATRCNTLQHSATHCNMGCRGLERESRKVEGRGGTHLPATRPATREGAEGKKIIEVYVNISTKIVEMILRGHIHEWSFGFGGHWWAVCSCYAAHFHALQHTATHCKLPQHTAPHCNTPF